MTKRISGTGPYLGKELLFIQTLETTDSNAILKLLESGCNNYNMIL